MVTRALPAILGLFAIAGCAHAASSAGAPRDASLIDPNGGAPRSVASLAAESHFTVVEFWSAHCPCQRAHDGRLRTLAEAYGGRGVRVIAVDSEVGASEERDGAEARSRAYPFPLLIDRGGALARSLGAEYATYSVVLDDRGSVVYRGAIDGDRTHLTSDARPYLKDALDDLLDGHAPRTAKSEALGCTLQLR